jgi:hypothetical protein
MEAIKRKVLENEETYSVGLYDSASLAYERFRILFDLALNASVSLQEVSCIGEALVRDAIREMKEERDLIESQLGMIEIVKAMFRNGERLPEDTMLAVKFTPAKTTGGAS